MSPNYLLHPEGLAALSRCIAPDTLFAFDLDGTLAPIQVHAAEVRLEVALTAFLVRLMELAKVCVLTGRSRQDALAILPFEPHLVIGNHGCEWPAEIRPRNTAFIEACQRWRDQLAGELSGLKGVFIEYKGESLALHYRSTDDPERALVLIEQAVQRLVPAPRVIGGKYVMNLLPQEGDTKGRALLAAMSALGSARAVYFGDDLTDEEVFTLVTELDLLGVHIGEDSRTAAPYFLKSQSEMLRVVEVIVNILREHRLSGAARISPG